LVANFEHLGLNRQLYNAIEDLAYDQPTPIQEAAIPKIMGGHDVLGIAQTGTGKTAAYVLPIAMIVKYAQGSSPRCVVFAPTRELVIQIAEAFGLFLKYTDLRFAAVYGGTGTKSQKEALAAGVDILIATPGRFMDLYRDGCITVKTIKILVLDEADKMMDMGFMPQIRKLLEVLPRKRQNLLFSATFSDKIERLSEEFLEAPLRIEVTPQATTAVTVEQGLYATPNLQTKLNLLLYLIQDVERGLIFARSREMANTVHIFLLKNKIPLDQIKVLHANKGQNTRINALAAFKEGKIRLLVVTDVIARGIDIDHVSHVFNFDVPLIYEDYVHRIGRTGRANNSGKAFTFMTMAEDYHIDKIEKIIRQTIPRLPLPEHIEVTYTPHEEMQKLKREVDDQKKKEDPTFKGAFHEKKPRPVAKKKKTSRSR
jgi:ATP-dependent RNA helicase RhlE